MKQEPTITINGVTLSEGQAMTLRVAAGHFAVNLQAEGLGDDEHRRAMTAGYLARLKDIFALMSEASDRSES